MKILLAFIITLIFYIGCDLLSRMAGIHCYFIGTMVGIVGACMTNMLFVILDIN